MGLKAQKECVVLCVIILAVATCYFFYTLSDRVVPMPLLKSVGGSRNRDIYKEKLSSQNGKTVDTSWKEKQRATEQEAQLDIPERSEEQRTEPGPGPQASSSQSQMEELYAQRRNHLKRQCQTMSDHYSPELLMKKYGSYLLDDEHHLMYCFVPKNGCSFWKRVFSILDGKHKGSAVFNLSGVAIHNSGGYDRLGKHQSSTERKYFLRSSKKFMFVRDPYERLFSGYIDKFFSPCIKDGEARKIIEKFRADKNRTSCDAGLSFTEFLQYVTNLGSMRVNAHFKRQYPVCLPCQADFDYIGKLETFQQDAEYILKEVAHIDPSEVFGASEDFEENSDWSIVSDVAERSFKRCLFSKICLSKYNVLLRLWVTFQVRGYISVKIKLPVSSQQAANNMTLTQFLALARQAFKQSGPDRALVKAQRKQALLEAFYSVPRSLLQRVHDYVSDDCLLFDYQCAIEERFKPSLKPAKPIFHMNEALGLEQAW